MQRCKKLSTLTKCWLLSRLPPGGRLSSKTLLTLGNSAPSLFNYVLHLAFVNKYIARILTGIGNAQQSAHSPASATSLWHVACTKASSCMCAHTNLQTYWVRTRVTRAWQLLDVAAPRQLLLWWLELLMPPHNTHLHTEGAATHKLHMLLGCCQASHENLMA